MKLFSSNSRGKRSIKGTDNDIRRLSAQSARKNNKGKMPRKKKIVIATCSILGAIILFGMSAFAVVRWQMEPFYSLFFRPTIDVLQVPVLRPSPNPERDVTDRPVLHALDEDGYEVPLEEIGAEYIRNMDMFTFLILGQDLHGNTDTIMVAAFDTLSGTMEVVSIPRDTLVNVSWAVKKANSIQANMRIRYRAEDNADELAMRATLEEFGNFLGFVPDFWVTVNMTTLPRLIDGIGGVEFRVPRNITHEGFTVPGGLQTLNGRQALHVLRYRGYAAGDIGRMSMQQQFLESAARQILANRNNINIATLADVFLNHVRTNIQLNHLIWFGREFLRLDSDSINFSTMPGVFESIAGGFYISVLLDEWLEVVNEKLNPNFADVTEETVSILTRNPEGRLFVTDGNWAGRSDWGANSRRPRATAAQTVLAPGALGGGGGGGGGAATRPPPDPDATLEDIPIIYDDGAHDETADDTDEADTAPPEDPGGDPPGDGDGGED